MIKTEILINKPVHLRLLILELSKKLVYEFWYDYVKPKYGEKVKLCYMGTDSFILYIKTDYIYKNIAEDVKTRFDTSNYKPLPKGKNKKVIGLMKDEFGGKIMAKFVGLRAKAYSYLIDHGSEEKSKRHKKYVIKRKRKSENYKNCSETTELDNKKKYLEKTMNIDSLKKNHKEFMRNNKSILKTR